MSEPKWWPKGEMPTEPGDYFRLHNGRTSGWTIPQETPTDFREGQFYGPIPDPPKEPPKLRRFTSIMDGKAVSGVEIVGYYCDRRFQIYKNGERGTYDSGIYREEDLGEIEYLDSP